MPSEHDSDGYEDELPLAELMHALASQLQKAREWAAQAAFSGEPSPIAWTDAQIEVGVTWTRVGRGELDLKVVRLGGDRTKENTATMTVSLAPASGQPERTVSRPTPMLLQLSLRFQGRSPPAPARRGPSPRKGIELKRRGAGEECVGVRA